MDKDEDFHVQKEEELQKMRKVRQNVIQEILVTEESYVNDLESCVDVFLQPKEEAKMRKDKIDMDILFSNFKQIYELAKKFLELLYKHVKNVDFNKQNVGQCFLNITEELKIVYSDYCATSDGAIAYLQKCDQNPLLIQKQDQLMIIHEDTNKSVSIMSMLLKPVQRITKYPLLISELLKATEENHVDYASLVEANKAIQNAVNAVNESKRTRELVTKYKRRSESSLWDRFSHLSCHSFQKKLTRARGYIAIHAGLYTEIKDEVFESKLHEFTSTKKTVEVLCDNLCNYIEIFEETMMTFCTFTSHVKELYGDAAFGSLFVSSLLELSNFVTTTIYQSVKTVIQSAVIYPLLFLIKSYEGPVALINKRWDKLMEIQGDVKLDLVKKEYEALNNQLIKELPKLCKMSLDVILNCIIVFNFVKETYLCEWKEHLGEVLKYIGSEKELESRMQQAIQILSHLRFNQFVDANYPVGLLANVLMNVPVLSPLSFSDNSFNQPLRHSVSVLPRSLAGKEKAIRTISSPGSFSVSLKSDQENFDNADASSYTSQAKVTSTVITPPISRGGDDDGFYYAKCPYYARMNQYEVSLYIGQFVTVIDKKDGNNNHDWWQVFTDDHHCGYCPAICLEKAENFMDSGQLPDLKELDSYNNVL